MKRISVISLTALLILFTYLAATNAQESKSSKQLKLIVEDKEGTRVLIDTTFKGILNIDTIKTKDGKMIFIGSHEGSDILVGTHENNENIIYVTTKSVVTTGDQKGEKEIRIISGDSVKVIKSGSPGHVVIMKKGEPVAEAHSESKMAWVVSEKDSGGNLVYINEAGPVRIKEGERIFNMEVITDGKGQSTAKSSYVIARDGMVISVEGDDEAKVKEMGKLIESKIDESSGNSASRPAEGKDISKKTVKK